jgi:uncharacterized protein (DUF4415 family)
MNSDRGRISSRSREDGIDPESLPTTRDEAKRIRRMSDAAPHVVAAYRKMLGRPPEGDAPKVAVSIRVDRDALAKFKASGPGWQTRINDLIVKAAAKLKPPKGKPARPSAR